MRKFWIILAIFVSCKEKPKSVEIKPIKDTAEVKNPVSTHRYGGYPDGCKTLIKL